MYLTLSVSKLPRMFQKKTCWKGLYSLHKIYRETIKKYMKNAVNQKWLKFKPTQIACPMPFMFAQALKTSEVCPIFLASLFCLLKKKGILDLQIRKRNSEFHIPSWKPVYSGRLPNKMVAIVCGRVGSCAKHSAYKTGHWGAFSLLNPWHNNLRKKPM